MIYFQIQKLGNAYYLNLLNGRHEIIVEDCRPKSKRTLNRLIDDIRHSRLKILEKTDESK